MTYALPSPSLDREDPLIILLLLFEALRGGCADDMSGEMCTYMPGISLKSARIPILNCYKKTLPCRKVYARSLATFLLRSFPFLLLPPIISASKSL